MVMKQPEVTERTRRKLCGAFWKLYSKQPVEKITVKQITDLAGYNRATFYLYYDGVRDLLEREEERLIARRADVIDEQAIGTDGSGSVRINLAAFLEQTRKDAPYIAILLGPHGDPDFANKIREFASPLILALAEGGHSEGKPGEYLREFYLSGVIALVRTWLADPDPMPIDELTELIVSTFMPNVTLE